MKRVRLHGIDDVRRAAIALGRFAVDGENGRKPLDPIHEHVTEGRRSAYERAAAKGSKMVPYSSCGDLAHWVLTMLGCRDERVVNRTDDGGKLSWAVGANISRLVGSPWYVHYNGGLPEVGDIVHVASPDHVCALLARGEVWETADYGCPYGKLHAFRLGFSGRLTLRGRKLQGWIDLARVPLRESAIVPDLFDGELDDNPYDEGLSIPAG